MPQSPKEGAQPFFSIIIPTYNRAHLIKHTLYSVLQQQFSSFEIILVDDGSTDDTQQVMADMNHPSVFYYKKENAERGAARNFGWRKANGKYVSFLDSDDIMYPNHLQNAFDQLIRLGFPQCLAQAYEVKDFKTGKIMSKGHTSHTGLINTEIINRNFLACFGVFIKTEIINEISFEEERRFAGTEDWLLWLQLGARYAFHFNNSVTGALIHHNGRSVLSMAEESLLFRPPFIKEKLEQDPFFMKVFGKSGVAKAYAHVLTYASLNLASGKKYKQAIQYLFRAFKVRPAELLHKRTLGIIKTILFKKHL